MKTLKETRAGESVNVVKVHGTGALRRRLLDMGITKGSRIDVLKMAPLGDPIEVTIRGYELSLRKSEGEMVEVEPII
ncbi:MAG: ferrous iron transport protein A [Cloacibacillus porcorum]|uniref:FeoA family protein n=1 Tax=Cloacibacillus porcorum TaxID=1197717 RepID=UPI0023F1B1EB|nr:ferrous iron transport protein A [Cloacibacillus porcorum]MCD7876264.1 ferrous iron transport protein A [Cloacibacillus porcorum]